MTGYGDPRQSATRAQPCTIEQPQVIWQNCQVTERFENTTDRVAPRTPQVDIVCNETNPLDLENPQHNKPNTGLPRHRQSFRQNIAQNKWQNDPKTRPTESSPDHHKWILFPTKPANLNPKPYRTTNPTQHLHEIGKVFAKISPKNRLQQHNNIQHEGTRTTKTETQQTTTNQIHTNMAGHRILPDEKRAHEVKPKNGQNNPNYSATLTVWTHGLYTQPTREHPQRQHQCDAIQAVQLEHTTLESHVCTNTAICLCSKSRFTHNPPAFPPILQTR